MMEMQKISRYLILSMISLVMKIRKFTMMMNFAIILIRSLLSLIEINYFDS